MTDDQDQLPPDETNLLDYILKRALEPEPQGVHATECDAVLRGDAALALHKLLHEHRLLAREDTGLYYPTLSAMCWRGFAFADSIAPIQGVLDYGHRVLDDRQNRDKVANVDDVVASIVSRFPNLSQTPVQTRFKWALFGMQPFIDVHQWRPNEHIPLTLRFPPALYGVKTLDDVFREQQIARDEIRILNAFRDAFSRTRRRKACAMVLGEDPRRDLALRSLIAKGDAEMLDTARVVATERGVEGDVAGWIGATPGLPQSMWPSVQAADDGSKSRDEPGTLEHLVDRLGRVGGFTATFGTLLERDAGEVEICLQHGAYKAALILCGSILEGVLGVGVLAQNRGIADREFKLLPGKQHKSFPDDASLPDLLSLARNANLKPGLGALLGDVHGDLAKLIKGHRDLVHPPAEVREAQLPINEYTANAVHGNLCALLDGVARQIEAGWLDRYRSA